jgi:Domain of unknown function (DUF4157)
MLHAAVHQTTSEHGQTRSLMPSLLGRDRSPSLTAGTRGLPGSPALSLPLRTRQGGIVQRKCVCGGVAGTSEECEACSTEPRWGLQRKLAMNEPGDRYEQEADRIADQVMGIPAHPAGHHAPPRIQRLATQPAGPVRAVPASVDHALASRGRPLEPGLRRDMEQRFGHDFSQIRVHTDSPSAESARALHAQAYTVGRDIVFAAGQYAPHHQAGKRLLVHELAHTIQQGAVASTPTSGIRIVQRQPQPGPESGPCPRGEIRLGPGLPCSPRILSGRKCPTGQVEFGGACVSLRPPLLGGTLTPPSPLSIPSPSSSSAAGTASVGAPASGKSARVLNMEKLRGCAYTVTYSNPRQMDCDTVFRNEHGKNSPVPLCGAALVYDITSVTASGSKCPTKLEGLKVSEVVKGDQGCTPPKFVWPAPNPCTIGPGGALTGCTDTFSLCGPTSDLQANTCTETVDQEIEVGGHLAEEHEIVFTLKKSGTGCTGTVVRR